MSKQKIVIADDSLYIRTTLKELFQENGYVITGEATNGMDTLEVLRATKPEILILDITMPKMTGLEILPIVKNEFPDLYIIMCSAQHQQSVIDKCKNLGANAYIVKPFSKDELLAAAKL